MALHNAEEALTIPGWLPPRLTTLAEFGVRPLASDLGRLYLGLLLATFVPLVWVALASRSSARSAGAYSIFVLYGLFLGNALVPHLLGVVVLQSYVPGAITAALLVVPYCMWLSRCAIAEGHASRRGVLLALATGLALYVPACIALLGLGGRTP